MVAAERAVVLNNQLSNAPDDGIFPNVNVETSFGTEIETKCRVPVMTGALGSTFIETVEISGIPYMTVALNESAMAILSE